MRPGNEGQGEAFTNGVPPEDIPRVAEEAAEEGDWKALPGHYDKVLDETGTPWSTIRGKSEDEL